MSKIYFDNHSLDLARAKIFHSLMGERQLNLFDVIELRSGDYLPKSKMKDGEYKVYGGGGITKSTHTKFNVDFKTVGIGRVGARCGCVFIIEKKSWVTDNALYVSKFKQKYDLNFLAHYLNRVNLNQFANQSAQPVISQRGIAKCTIPDIDFCKQQEIGIILDAIEKGEDFEDTYDLKTVLLFEKNLSLLNAELDQQQTYINLLRQTILQEAVQGKLTKQDPTDEPAAELLKRIKAEKEKLIEAGKPKKEKELPPITEDEIPFELPNGWTCCRLVDIASVGTGATPLTTSKEYYKGSIPWITSSATGSLFVTVAEKNISEKALIETNCRVYPVGTLIVAMYGQGKTRGQITELLIEAATNQACAAIELIIVDENHKKYIKYFFQKIYLEIRELAEGGAQPNLNLQKIKDTLIPLPPLSEQQRIVTKVQQLQQQLSQLETQVQQSRKYGQQLLQSVLREAFEEKGALFEMNQETSLVAENETV